MKPFLFLPHLFFPILVFAQTTSEIDSLVKLTDRISYYNSISIDDTTADFRYGRAREITAYMSGDTIKKVVVRFLASSRIREVYFGPLEDYQRKVIYVKDTDSTDGRLLFEVYGWDGKLLKSKVISALDTNELASPELALFSADYETRVRFHVVDSKAKKYTFKCKLKERVPFPPGCGMFAWAVVHKFEVLETDRPDYKGKYVLIIQSCPEFIGQEFFKKAHLYRIRAATNSGVTFSYSIVNKYKYEQLPIFWCREIDLLSKL